MNLLIIGTLDGQIGAASQIAMARGATVRHSPDIAQALAVLRGGEGIDLVMADVGLDLAALVGALTAERILTPVIACGVATDAQAAVRAIRAGAKEYLPLPPDAELIAAILEAVTDDSRTLIAKDSRMAQVLAMADQIAGSSASVLITGESGTGKEMIARRVHQGSSRHKGRFVAVNCAAIPENLLESELFGHEKGAFTGAVARRLGKFEEANNGTLLLDEISEMDPRLQAKLLRVLQEGEVDRLGGSRPVKVDVRILATSNRDLETEIAAGRFRQDLYFRLNVMHLVLPPLRERPADIPVLARHFARKYAEANGVAERPLSDSAFAKLGQHTWPGNVRELENALHRAVLLSTGPEIDADAILLGSAGERATASAGSEVADGSKLVGRTVADVERVLILDTLSHTLGNRTHAATILGISIRTLRNKLKLYSGQGFAVPPPGEGERAGA
jgi:two-component system response regulator FlrC